MRKLSVIVPVYNEEEANIQVIASVFQDPAIELIVVDDGSEIPVEIDPQFRAKILRREKNTGYGAAIKYGISQASGDYIAIIDGDLQYDPVELWEMWTCMFNEDMVIGKRITHQGGWKRFWGRMFIKIVASIFAGRYIPDLNSGARIFKKSIAKSYFSLLCDEFSFTTSLTMCMVLENYKVRWLPIGFYPRTGAKSTLRMVRHGLITLFQIVYITIGIKTRRLRKWLRN